MRKYNKTLPLFIIIFALLAACSGTSNDDPVALRLGVSLTPQELESFQEALTALDDAHPEWTVTLEISPQQGVIEKINTQLAANELPDVFRVQSLQVHQWIRQEAFLALDDYIAGSDLNLDDFFPGPVEQFQWQEQLWGLPDTAAPDIVFYNKDMFDASGVNYPTDDWTFEDMRDAALLLTLDQNGRNATDSNFDPEQIVQWGWNGSLTNFWQRHMVRPFGGDFCANDDCTLMTFTAPETITALEWWSTFTHEDNATLYDPYGGSQTGVPGDPFIAGKAAMGFNGYFAIGQLNDATTFDYDIVQPFLGQGGQRYTPLSTNGYVIAANSEHPDAAWELIQALTTADFLSHTWGEPGHSVPVLRPAANSILNAGETPSNKQAILEAMEYGEVFKPYTASAFAAFGATSDLIVQAMRGDRPIPEIAAEMETAANQALAPDR
jgi:multiple sugar transport system substrate-binding protein